jgi:hypothetical protein
LNRALFTPLRETTEPLRVVAIFAEVLSLYTYVLYRLSFPAFGLLRHLGEIGVWRL